MLLAFDSYFNSFRTRNSCVREMGEKPCQFPQWWSECYGADPCYKTDSVNGIQSWSEMCKLTRSWEVPSSSMTRDWVLETCTPSSLCTPQHSRQIITPKLTDSHSGSEKVSIVDNIRGRSGYKHASLDQFEVKNTHLKWTDQSKLSIVVQSSKHQNNSSPAYTRICNYSYWSYWVSQSTINWQTLLKMLTLVK